MFLLFVGAHYYPKGGWFDFVGAYETLSEAKSQLKSKESEAVARGWSIRPVAVAETDQGAGGYRQCRVNPKPPTGPSLRRTTAASSDAIARPSTIRTSAGVATGSSTGLVRATNVWVSTMSSESETAAEGTWILCDLCNGVGHDPDPDGWGEPCDNCAGRGMMRSYAEKDVLNDE